MPAMKVREVLVADVRPYPGNPRNNDNAVEAVAASIREFGWQQPIVVDADMTVIAGHTRLKAAQRLGLATVPVHVASELTTEQVAAYRLADNKVGELATWDMGALAMELDGLSAFDMGQFGFDMDSMDGLFEDVPTELGTDVEEVSVRPDEDVEERTARGDVWKLGRHVLMCGDSTSASDVSRLMDGTVAQAMFTDPPYGVSYVSNCREKTSKFEMLKNDDSILDFIPAIKPHVDGFVFVCTSWKVLDVWFDVFGRHYELTNMVIWDKGGGGIGDLKKTYATDFEVILVSNCGKALTGKRIGSVWSCGKDLPSEYMHPTQKPVCLAATAIETTTREGDTVVDVFGGSGSTLLACEQTGRSCRTMELDPHYCDVILHRWEKLTGQKAELVRDE